MWLSSLPCSAVLCALLGLQSLAGLVSAVPPSHDGLHQDSDVLHTRRATIFPSVTADNASHSDIQAARQIVKDAIAKMTKLNKARLAKPSPNNFKLKPGTKVSRRDEDAPPPPPPLLDITDEIARAAALIAELDTSLASNTTLDARRAAPNSKRAGAFWMEGLARKGTVPWGNDASYKVGILPSPVDA